MATCVWQCRLLLAIVLAHVALSSPVVRRDVLALADDSEHNDPLAQIDPETLGEETFGGDVSERGGRDKRLLLTKTLGVGALGVKAAKAVGAKVVATGAKVIGAKVLKVGAAVKAAAVGAVGVKTKALGIKAATAVAAIGIKALIFKLLFGLAKSSLLPRRHPSSSAGATVTAAPDTGDEDIPTFDPNRVSLQVPDELFAPAFNSVNSISSIFGNLIQKTAERIARLVESAKPLLRSSLGFGSKKRQAANSATDTDPNELDGKGAETTYFTDSQAEVQEAASSENSQQTTKADDAENSIIKSSYAALSSS